MSDPASCMMRVMFKATRVADAIAPAHAKAAADLLPLVYEELRKLAAQRLAHEKAGQTLQPTALVHEAYLRLVDSEQAQRWEGRGHFFAAAAEAMRRILIDNARRKRCLKHGGMLQRVELDELDELQLATDGLESSVDLLALDEALTRLAQLDATKAQLVNLRFFAGLTLEEAGQLLDLSPATADRYWAFARAWLFRELGGGLGGGSGGGR